MEGGLLKETRTIAGHKIIVYSLDGKSWSSNPADLPEMQKEKPPVIPEEEEPKPSDFISIFDVKPTELAYEQFE